MQRSYCPKTVLGTMIFQRSALEAELFRSGAAARKYNAYAAKALCKNTDGALGGHMAEHANIMLFKNGFWHYDISKKSLGSRIVSKWGGCPQI